MIRSQSVSYVLSCGGGSSLEWTETESRSDVSDAVDKGRSLTSDTRREQASSVTASLDGWEPFLSSSMVNRELIERSFTSTADRLCNAAMVAATSEPPRPSSRMFSFKMSYA